MHVQSLNFFRLFREGHSLAAQHRCFCANPRRSFIGAEPRLVHELLLSGPLNGVLAGAFARHAWLN